jgi:hypothetical protein
MAYWGSGGIVPLILRLGTRWRWIVSFTPRPLYPQGRSSWCPFDRRLGGPQRRSGRGSEKKNSQPLPGLKPQCCKTELSWLLTKCTVSFAVLFSRVATIPWTYLPIASNTGIIQTQELKDHVAAKEEDITERYNDVTWTLCRSNTQFVRTAINENNAKPHQQALDRPSPNRKPSLNQHSVDVQFSKPATIQLRWDFIVSH